MLWLVPFLTNADPTVIAIGDWVIAEKTAKGWKAPAKTLHGKEITLKSWRNDQSESDYFGNIEFDPGPPMESVRLKDVENPGPDTLFVSGNPTFAPVTRISPENLDYRRIASLYVRSQGHKHSSTVSDGIQADLDGDGRKEVLLVINANDPQKSTVGFCAVVLRQLSGSAVKTKTLALEGKYGYMRGPFTANIFGAGDFDGDGKREFIYSISDPWGIEVKLAQLAKGKVKTLLSAGFGE